jgi:hypothetical protein
MLLHSNRSYSIVSCVFFAAEMCLPNTCLAMDVSSELTIPAFGRHVTALRNSGTLIMCVKVASICHARNAIEIS